MLDKFGMLVSLLSYEKSILHELRKRENMKNTKNDKK